MLTATTLIVASLFIAGAVQLRLYADVSEDRRNSFATSDVDTLSGLKQRLTIVVRLAPEDPRYIAVRDGALNHLVHHRAQLTVYLRLNDAPVPSLYGPSADEQGFG